MQPWLAGTHTPAEHVWVVVQTFPHEPQLSGSRLVGMHLPPHSF
jgi:hypothetical protein